MHNAHFQQVVLASQTAAAVTAAWEETTPIQLVFLQLVLQACCLALSTRIRRGVTWQSHAQELEHFGDSEKSLQR